MRGRGGHRGGGGNRGGGGQPVWQQYKDRAMAQKQHRDPAADAAATGAGSPPPSPRRHRAEGAPAEPLQVLSDFFRRVHEGPYPALKDLRGRAFDCGGGTRLYVESIQADPYAPSSQFTVAVPYTLPPDLCRTSDARIALEDRLLRDLHTRPLGGIEVAKPSQHVLQRSAVVVQCGNNGGTPESIELRVRVPMPAFGRRINGKACHHALVENLVPAARAALLADSSAPNDVRRVAAMRAHVDSVLDQTWLRDSLAERGLIAFVADGSVLPRSSGDDDGPLRSDGCIAFESPATLKVEATLPHSQRTIKGMGIPSGVTCVAGGAFHGKSTLLRALEVGVYNHVPGDGREFVSVDPTAVKIRAEDRRSVAGVDVSAFVANLPSGADTSAFTTLDASGSTSQAANVVEAIEAGATCLLVDEDTAATNFMVRDPVMAELIAAESEPITPMVARVKALAAAGVSTVVVAGGTHQFLAAANTVIVLDRYRCRDATARAHTLVQPMASTSAEAVAAAMRSTRTLPLKASFAQCVGDRGLRFQVRDHGRSIQVGEEFIRLELVEQLVETEQVNAIAATLGVLSEMQLQRPCIADVNAAVQRTLQQSPTFDIRSSAAYMPHGVLARPRLSEVLAALNRFRPLAALLKR